MPGNARRYEAERRADDIRPYNDRTIQARAEKVSADTHKMRAGADLFYTKGRETWH